MKKLDSPSTGRVLTLTRCLGVRRKWCGLWIEVASSTANSVEIDKIVTLETLLIVREDAQILFGLTELTEKKLFQLLIKINGVGPRLAIGIMSRLNEDELSLAIMEKDIKILTSLPGVGKKTAERLVIELQDKITFEKASGEKQIKNVSRTAIGP